MSIGAKLNVWLSVWVIRGEYRARAENRKRPS